MKRKVIDELINWKSNNNGKPILLTGAKGVGKTYLAYDFARAFFERICYINFEREPKVSNLFQLENPNMIEEQLAEYFHVSTEEPLDTRVLILDEISCCTEAFKVLKTQHLEQLFRYIICISSITLSAEAIDEMLRIPIYPLEFDEFLRATSNEWYIESIITHFNSDSKIPDIVHKELLALHELYLRIGGMPGCINEYLNLSSAINVSEQHNFLIGSYHDYILRDNTDSEALKMNQVFDSLILQLMKENKKFQYKLIRKGTTHTMYKDAIRKLSELNYVIKCNRISSDQLINAYDTFHSEEWQSVEANTNFKLYLPDAGMLCTKIVEEQGSILDVNHKLALLENYVATSLQSKNYPFGFWESDSMAKVDFMFLRDREIYPVEIFEGENTRSKSISILKQKIEFPYAIKISSKNFEFSNQIKYVPYYAVFCL